MLAVIGGAYFETCQEPFWNELYGSGFRSAVALSQSGVEIAFHTYADTDSAKRLEILSSQLGINLHCHNTPASYHFGYLHPLSEPSIFSAVKRESPLDPISIETNNDVVCFGMMEGQALVKGRRVVYDPQSPGKPIPFGQNGSTAEELILVLNYDEAATLAGSVSLVDIAVHMIQQEKAHLTVVKNGPFGAFLIRQDLSCTPIPAYRTKRVWTVGSGDIFTSYFALYYLVRGCSALDAAMQASLATAWYSENITLPVPDDLSGFAPTPFHQVDPTQKKVYLAGPFFTMSQRWLINEFLHVLEDIGFKVFSPFHDVGIGEPDEVVEPDLEGLKDADIIIAVLDGLDSGTLFEVGYAISMKKKVVGFCQNEPKESLTMILGSGVFVYDDFLTTIYQLVWHAHD